MNTTKEQMLEWLDQFNAPSSYAYDWLGVKDAIRALIESSGEKAPIGKPDPDPESLEMLRETGIYFAPPAPLPKEVEEAMGRMALAIHEAGLYRHLLVKRAIASTYTVARVEKDFDDDQSALAVLKSALQPKAVSRGWVEKYAIEISNKAGAAEDSWPNIDSLDAKEIIMSMLRELGIEVGP